MLAINKTRRNTEETTTALPSTSNAATAGPGLASGITNPPDTPAPTAVLPPSSEMQPDIALKKITEPVEEVTGPQHYWLDGWEIRSDANGVTVTASSSKPEGATNVWPGFAVTLAGGRGKILLAVSSLALKKPAEDPMAEEIAAAATSDVAVETALETEEMAPGGMGDVDK